MRCSEIGIHEWYLTSHVRIHFPPLWQKHLPMDEAEVEFFETGKPGGQIIVVLQIDLKVENCVMTRLMDSVASMLYANAPTVDMSDGVADTACG